MVRGKARRTSDGARLKHEERACNPFELRYGSAEGVLLCGTLVPIVQQSRRECCVQREFGPWPLARRVCDRPMKLDGDSAGISALDRAISAWYRMTKRKPYLHEAKLRASRDHVSMHAPE